MRRITIAGQSFDFERAELVAYHCASEEADWNLELVRDGRTMWLSGTMAPGPGTIAALEGAAMRLDPRSLDEVAEQLIDRIVSLYPRQPQALEFRLARTPGGVRFTIALEADWDPALASFTAPGAVPVQLAIEAELGSLHPGHLPGPER